MARKPECQAKLDFRRPVGRADAIIGIAPWLSRPLRGDGVLGNTPPREHREAQTKTSIRDEKGQAASAPQNLAAARAFRCHAASRETKPMARKTRRLRATRVAHSLFHVSGEDLGATGAEAEAGGNDRRPMVYWSSGTAPHVA
jgi:hypothetical protein